MPCKFSVTERQKFKCVRLPVSESVSDLPSVYRHHHSISFPLFQKCARSDSVSSSDLVLRGCADKPSSGLAGEHQIYNASLAYRLCQDYLKAAPAFSSDSVDDQNAKLLQGLESASWPGRCQVLPKDQVTWFFDGAHTVESLELAGSWFSTASSS